MLLSLVFQFGIECIPQAVAEQVQRQHHQADGDCREHQRPGVIDQVTCGSGIGCQRAKAGHGGVNAQPQEAQVALGKDCVGDLQSGGDNDHADAVGDQVLADDPATLGTGRLRRQHVLLLTQGEDLTAHQTGGTRPGDEGQIDHQKINTVLGINIRCVQNGADDQQDRHTGQTHQNIAKTHDDIIDSASEESCNTAHNNTSVSSGENTVSA